MSHRCLESLTGSHIDGLCGPAQNGHRGLILTVMLDFLVAVRNEAVSGAAEVRGSVCDPISSMYNSLRMAVCSSDSVHSLLPCALTRFCLTLDGNLPRNIGMRRLP